MLDIILIILAVILAPAAVIAIFFTGALCIGLIKGIAQEIKKQNQNLK